MRKVVVALAAMLATIAISSTPSSADPNGTGSCFTGRFGGTIDCGGGYVVTTPASPAQSPGATLSGAHTVVRPVVLAPYVANGPAGPCMALGPVGQVNTTIAAWAATQQFPPCPATGAGPALAPINPAALAIQFWQTIPLPVPHPSIPPGYAITGKPAYLVTNGTLAPAPYQRPTPLGPLTITARGSYRVDWGDGTLPTWTGPYGNEGRAYPNGNIFHTYDNTGTVTVTVRELWTATWALGPAGGNLNALQTTATIPAYRVDQLQAVLTG